MNPAKHDLEPRGQPAGSQTDEMADGEQVISAVRPAMATAGLCFAVVLAACGYGIYLIVKAG